MGYFIADGILIWGRKNDFKFVEAASKNIRHSVYGDRVYRIVHSSTKIYITLVGKTFKIKYKSLNKKVKKMQKFKMTIRLLGENFSVHRDVETVSPKKQNNFKNLFVRIYVTEVISKSFIVCIPYYIIPNTRCYLSNMLNTK